jgi:ubiquinone/menaquinone biosynthesis C-methylase UbiE
MSRITAFFYDRFMARVEQACLREWRRELLQQVHGDVLEIGAGTGASIVFYPRSVSRLVLSEPDPHMRKRLVHRADSEGLPAVRICGDSAEAIDADDASFDFVVASLVCCSMSSLESGIHEIHRVLRPGGGFVFLEHVAAAKGSSRRRWQDRINPLWKRLMGNCHLNRETESVMLSSGFDIARIERESMHKAPPLVRPTIRGIAIKS